MPVNRELANQIKDDIEYVLSHEVDHETGEILLLPVISRDRVPFPHQQTIGLECAGFADHR